MTRLLLMALAGGLLELAFQNAIQGLQGQLWQTQQAINQQAEWDTTGHPAAFLSHTSYFMTTGATNRPGTSGGPMAPARPTLGGGFGQAPGRPGIGR